MTDDSAATSGHDAPNAAATTPTTVEQAAAILGVSVTTVKRRIRAGTLRAEQAQRPQGTVWLVYLPAAATAATEERPPAARVVATTAATPSEQMATLAAAFITPVLAPLVAEITASRQTIERQAETIGELRATVATLEARTAPQSVEVATGPIAWLWGTWGAVASVLAILVVLTLMTVLLWR